MRRNASLGICLAIALGIVGCQNETTEPAAPTAAPSLAVASTTHHVRLNPSALPASIRNRLPSSEHVIDPSAYQCRQATRVGNWFNSQINQIPLPILRTLVLDLAAPDVATIEALLFELFRPGTQQFGYTGEFNTVMLNTESSVKSFWGWTTPNVLLGAMKGSVLLNKPVVAFIYRTFFTDEDANGNPIPITATQAAELADQLADLVANTRSLKGGNHPLFSFNAFALPAIPGLAADKVVMGDGVLEGYAAAGLGNIAALAPQAVYGHEFGHHIQFKNGYGPELPGANAETSDAEFTRYTELMADAYSGYYLAHQNLGKTTKQQIRDAERAFFNLGDCAFDNPGHHGTPNQREAAVDFGMQVASEGGPLLNQQAFHARFVTKYPDLIAPDSPLATH